MKNNIRARPDDPAVVAGARQCGDSVMERRVFITTVAVGLLAAPFATFAQGPAKVPRIGVLGNVDGPAWDGFRLGLRDLGYTDGRNIALEWRWAEGKGDRFSAFAVELVQMRVDLIVTTGTQATGAAKQATGSIPIVMTSSVYPDKIGLVESLARPGGNVSTDFPGNASDFHMTMRLRHRRSAVMVVAWSRLAHKVERW